MKKTDLNKPILNIQHNYFIIFFLKIFSPLLPVVLDEKCSIKGDEKPPEC